MAETRIKVHQLTDGVDGELITWDASGIPSTVATGSAGHVLTSNGVGTAPTFQAVTVTGIVDVANGGTGRNTSTTPYGIITAGTTATGVHQTLPAGLTTEILVGGGTSALPIWTTATGTGAPVRANSPTLGAYTATQPSVASVGSGNGTAAGNVTTITGATGGATSANSGSVTGGTGGSIVGTAGNGGAITGTPATGFGGTGGQITLTAGDGGTGTTFGGQGGNANIQAGNGGNGTTPGSGGYAALKAGNGSSSGNSSGGNVFVVGGIKTGSGVDGDIYLGVSPSFAVRGNVKIGGSSAPVALLTLGEAGTKLGNLSMAGSTSGTITIQPAAAAGTYTLTLPTSDGDPSQFLQTDGSGNLSWATAGGGGTVTATGGSLTANSIVLGAGTTDTKVVAGIITDGTSMITLGVNATTLGKLKLFGNTSGDVTIQATAAAGTATVQTLPATTGTLVNRVTTSAGVSASNSDGALTFTLGAITPTTVNGHTFTAGSSTFTGSAGQTYTFPTTTATLARIDAANTFTGIQTFSTPIAATSVATMTASVGGGVPTPPNNTTDFLRGDGTWGVPTGTVTTASNGINRNVNDFQLGGTLSAATTITGAGNALTMTSSRAGATNAGFNVTNSSTGTAIKGSANGVGSGTGYGVWGTSNENYGIKGDSVGFAGGAFFTSDSGTTTVLNGLIVDRQTSGSAGTGLGTSIQFQLESSTTISQLSNTLISKWTNATHADRVSEFSITGVDNEIESTLFTLSGSGQLKLNKYGVNSFTGTAAYALHVDSSGNIIEGSLSGGTPTTIEVSNDNINGSSVYPVWTSGASSSQALKISTTKISFVPSTGELTAGTFIGNLTGNASGTSANVTGTVAIANGGTGQTSAANAINALVPTQTGNSGKFLTTNGTTVSWATTAGGLSDGDYGDVIVSGTGTVMTIDNLAVTNAKINDVSISKLTSGTAAAGLTFTVPNTSTLAFRYNGSASALIVSDTDSTTTIFSEDGTQYVSASDTNVSIGSGTTLMEYVDGVLRLYDSDATHYVGIQTPATANLTTSYTLTLPTNDGSSSGQVLTTDGAGVLSWTTPTVGDVVGPAGATDNEIVLFNTSTGKLVKAATGSGIVKATAGVYSTVTAPAGTIIGTTDTQTLTNKRVDPRVTAVTTSFTPDVSASDMIVVTGLAGTCTIGAPSGTPVQGTKLMFRIKDNGTARTLTWNAIYRACGVPLPTITVASKTMYVGMIFNDTDDKWDVVSLTQEA